MRYRGQQYQLSYIRDPLSLGKDHGIFAA